MRNSVIAHVPEAARSQTSTCFLDLCHENTQITKKQLPNACHIKKMTYICNVVVKPEGKKIKNQVLDLY